MVSFGMIVYWYTSLANVRSGVQAMTMNKVGDVGILLGMALLFLQLGGTE